MDTAAILSLTIANSIALLILVSFGLAIIFGMMKVINFAHGEFIMLGGYTTVVAVQNGVNLWVAMLILSPMVVGLVGAIVERLVIRRLYGHLITTMLATWGVSLLLIGLVTTIFGNTLKGVSAPLGAVQIGIYSFAIYQIVLMTITAALFIAAYVILRHSNIGLIARATMQNPEMASTLGVSQRRVYSITFILGAAVTGLAGGLLAPISGVIPHMGSTYVAKAFVTVITGGESVITGLLTAAVVLGPIESIPSFLTTPIIGQASLLLVAIVILRLAPNGISGLWSKGR
ncbi:ABC transporter permease subunit [Rhizobium sp.]